MSEIPKTNEMFKQNIEEQQKNSKAYNNQTVPE